MGRLDGKVALITGLAGAAGESHAIRLAEEGADIIALEFRRQADPPDPSDAARHRLAEVTSRIEALGRRVWVSRADVNNLEELTEAISVGVSQFGRVDVAIAGVGISDAGDVEAAGATGRFWEVDGSRWRHAIDANLTDVWHITRAVTPHLLATRSGGSIVLVGSVFGTIPSAALSAYVASTHAVIGLARSLALELGPEMIRVNTILATTVNTPNVRSGSSDGDALEQSRKLHALPVPGVELADISNALVFLASDEARYMTGVELLVDAGFSAKSGSRSQKEALKWSAESMLVDSSDDSTSVSVARVSPEALS